MRALVIAGGGPIGQAVIRALIERGDEPFWTSRQADPQEGAEVGHLHVDRNRPGDIVQVVRDLQIETVIDVAAYAEASTQPLLTALQGVVNRYVLVSSSDVYRWAIAPMVSQAPLLEVPTAWLNWTTTYGYIENVAAAVAHCAADSRAANAVFNAADETAISHREWIERLRRATDWAGAAEPTGADTPFSRALSGLDLSVTLVVSAQRLFTDLEFMPPVAPDTAARLTIADEVARRYA